MAIVVFLPQLTGNLLRFAGEAALGEAGFRWGHEPAPGAFQSAAASRQDPAFRAVGPEARNRRAEHGLRVLSLLVKRDGGVARPSAFPLP